jgi:hypothetical protein
VRVVDGSRCPEHEREARAVKAVSLYSVERLRQLLITHSDRANRAAVRVQ